MEHIVKKYLNKKFYAIDENYSKLYLIKANNEQGEGVGKIYDGEVYFLYGYIMTELNSRLLEINSNITKIDFNMTETKKRLAELGSIMSVVEIQK